MKKKNKKRLLGLFLAGVMSVCSLGSTVSLADETETSAAYTPGTYSATAKGFGGDVTVTMTFSEDGITEVTAEGDSETPGVGSLAIEQLPDIIMEAQSAEVDGISGCTYSSDALIEAAADCISQAAGTAEEKEAVEADMTPGTYRGEAQGFSGTIVVDVTVTEDEIVSVDIVDTVARENELIDTTNWLAQYLIDMLNESPMVFETVSDRLPERIVENQSLEVDTITGATASSNGLLSAVRNALEQAGGNLEAFEVPVEKKTDEVEYTADVIVVGGGTSGATAAAKATEEGAQVLLIEKSGRIGGTGALSSQPMTFGASIQEEVGFDTEALIESTYNSFMTLNNWSINGLVLEKFLRGSGSVVDWLMENGFEFTYTEGNTYVDYAEHSIGTLDQLEAFEEMCADVDQILYETTVTGLILDEDNQVIGVEAVSDDGTSVTAYAKSVIVATGGFAGNQDMMDEYDNGTVKLLGLAQNDGAGLTMMLEAGAAEHNVGGNCAHQTEVPVQVSGFDDYDTAYAYTITNLPVLMRVSTQGQRFMNEDEKSVSGPTTSTSQIVAVGGTFYTLLDQSQYDALKAEGSAALGMDKDPDASFWTYPLSPDDAMYNLDEVMDALIDIGMAFKGDTLEELAEVSGMDIDVLKSSISTYNESCEAGEDQLFYKDSSYLNAYGDGPYYAVVGCAMSYNTLGGVEVDEFMRVLSTEGSAIKGLYAAGTDSIGTILNGVAYPDLFGVALGWGFNSGYMAGEYAAQYALANADS